METAGGAATSEPATPTEEDPDANDPVRLWEDGWKARYYKVKFNVLEEDVDFRRKLARHYTIGLQWVLKYYYQGCMSWNWYFPYHYAPFASDFNDIADADFNEDGTSSEPFKPFEQLMAVFPAASRKHVPGPWQTLMIDEKSPIIDFYPEDFQVDLNGKKASWQGVALLPFVDEVRLKQALESYQDKLSAEELKRNTRGNDRIFVRKSHPVYEFFKELYNNDGHKKYKKMKHAIELNPEQSGGISGRVWCDEYVVLESETVQSPIAYACVNIPNNQVLSVQFVDPVYEKGFVFKANLLKGVKMPESMLKPEDFEQRGGYNQNGGNGGGYRPRLGFNQQNDYRQNKDAGPANRMAQNSMRSSGFDNSVSSAHGGPSSVYGVYRTSSNFTQYNNNGSNYNNNNNNQNNYHQNNQYNNNNSGNNDQGRNNYNYNNNRGGGAGYNNNNNNNGNGNNYNGNNNNNYQNNRRPYNNNNRGGGGGNGGGYGNNNYNNNNRYQQQQ